MSTDSYTRRFDQTGNTWVSNGYTGNTLVSDTDNKIPTKKYVDDKTSALVPAGAIGSVIIQNGLVFDTSNLINLALADIQINGNIDMNSHFIQELSDLKMNNASRIIFNDTLLAQKTMMTFDAGENLIIGTDVAPAHSIVLQVNSINRLTISDTLITSSLPIDLVANNIQTTHVPVAGNDLVNKTYADSLVAVGTNPAYIYMNSVIGAAATRFMAQQSDFATVEPASYVVSDAITVTRLVGSTVTAPGIGEDYTMTLLKNFAATALVVTVSGASTTAAATGSIAFANGDTLSIKIVSTAGVAASAAQYATIKYFF